MTTSVPSVPVRKPGLKAWAAVQREKAGVWGAEKREQGLVWARAQEQSPSAFRRKAGATLIENTELMMKGRSLSRVYRLEQVRYVDESGQVAVREVEVLKKVPSTFLGVFGSLVAAGSTAFGIGYFVALFGGALFAMVAAGARKAKRHDIAVPAARLSALTTMAMIPVAGNAFVGLILMSEINALWPRKPAAA